MGAHSLYCTVCDEVIEGAELDSTTGEWKARRHKDRSLDHSHPARIDSVADMSFDTCCSSGQVKGNAARIQHGRYENSGIESVYRKIGHVSSGPITHHFLEIPPKSNHPNPPVY